MKTAITSAAKDTQNPASSPQRSLPSPGSGRLGQLAAIMNQGPQVQAQLKLSDEIQNGERVQNQLALAAQMNQAPVAQQRLKEEEPAQREEASNPNRTGLPDQLKAGVEHLSGISLDDVKVHYNSAKPAQLNALAYAQGTDIHVAPGQEQHLPHETWHVVQQAQGRVQPTIQLKDGVPVNDDDRLEQEAGVLGARALEARQDASPAREISDGLSHGHPNQAAAPESALTTSDLTGVVAQRALATDADILKQKTATFNWTSFRGKRKNANDGTATEEGRGAKLSTGTAIRTSVQWGPLDAASGEGTHMEAIVGPDHNLGSPPSAQGATRRVQAFAALSGQSYISGHLMNEKLGGPGDESRNLTAISGSANTLQSSNIEKYVRDPVNEEGAWMKYKVGVTYTDDVKSSDPANPNLLAALQANAKGLRTEPIPGSSKVNVFVRHASKLEASWYPLDVAGGFAARAETRVINIQSPLAHIGGQSEVKATAKTGVASGKAAAKTNILAEELVLTKSDLLKHVVTSRAPLALRIQQLKDNIEALEGSAGEWQGAMAKLTEEAKVAGKDAAYSYGLAEVLADNLLGFRALKPEIIDVPGYQDALIEGEKAGRAAGQLYVDGYKAGKDAGWADDKKSYFRPDKEYVAGYDRGYEEGRNSGDYSQGRKYVFFGMALVLDKNTIGQNITESLRGATTVELTGNWLVHSGRRWYEVRVISTSDVRVNLDPRKEGYWNGLGWMNRRWLMKGI